MSCYEKSLGIIILPTQEWSKFKKEFEQSYSNHLKGLYLLANEAYQTLLKAKKDREIKDYELFFNDLKISNFLFRKLSFNDYEIIIKSIFHKGTNKIKKPKKSDFLLKNRKKENKERKITFFYDDDLSVSLNHKEKKLIYSTDDNNHSVDNADNSFIGSTILKMLDKVEFSNRTGGYFRYQSEYDEDSNGFNTGSRIIKKYGKYRSKKYVDEKNCDLF